MRLLIASCIGLTATLGACRERHDHPPATKPAAAAHADHGHDEHGHAHDDHGHDEHDDHGHEGHGDEVRLTPEAIQRWGIKTESVRKRELTEVLTVPGRVALSQDRVAHVGSPLAGRAALLKAGVGSRVAAGDVLLAVDSPELGEAQSAYLQARSEAASARPAVELARSAWERGKALHEQSQGLALTEVQRREAELRAAEATLAVARSSLTAAENRLKLLGLTDEAIAALAEGGPINPRFEIRSPFTGEVVQREVTLGEQVGPDDHELFVIADLTTLWVLADVPETRLGEIGAGSAATVRSAALGERGLRGRVSHVSPSLDPATRTGTARIEIHDPPAALRPGVFVRVSIETGGRGAATLVVPDAAVQTVEGEPSVFVPVAGELNTYARRAVKLGRRVGDLVAIESGLGEGEPVVVSGSFILKAELGKSEAGHEH